MAGQLNNIENKNLTVLYQSFLVSSNGKLRENEKKLHSIVCNIVLKHDLYLAGYIYFIFAIFI